MVEARGQSLVVVPPTHNLELLTVRKLCRLVVGAFLVTASAQGCTNDPSPAVMDPSELPTSTEGLPQAPSASEGVQYLPVLSFAEGAAAAASDMNAIVGETDRSPLPPDLSEVMFGLYSVASGSFTIAAIEDSGHSYLALLTAYPTRAAYDRLGSGGSRCDPSQWASTFVGGLTDETVEALERNRALEGFNSDAPEGDARVLMAWFLELILDGMAVDAS
jgi:hypothetical protein